MKDKSELFTMIGDAIRTGLDYGIQVQVMEGAAESFADAIEKESFTKEDLENAFKAGWLACESNQKPKWTGI